MRFVQTISVLLALAAGAMTAAVTTLVHVGTAEAPGISGWDLVSFWLPIGCVAAPIAIWLVVGGKWIWALWSAASAPVIGFIGQAGLAIVGDWYVVLASVTIGSMLVGLFWRSRHRKTRGTSNQPPG